MDLLTAVLLVAILEYIAFAMLVGYARGKYGITAPAVTGHPEFERYVRVQQNTLELLVPLLPAAWFFGRYLSPTWAALLATVYVLGRAWYAATYIRDPKRRGLGFALSFLPLMALTVGALYGAVRALLA